MHISLMNIQPVKAYALLTQVVVPRPIAWVLSTNENGTLNLAPFSYFNVVSDEPPMLMISFARNEAGERKDSCVNVHERKNFVVNIAHVAQAADLTATSAPLPSGESELDHVDLPLAEMPGSQVPRVASCKVAMACEYHDTKVLKRHDIVFATISDLYVHDNIVTQDAKGRAKVDAEKFEPLARLGGGEYATFGKVFSIARPT